MVKKYHRFTGFTLAATVFVSLILLLACNSNTQHPAVKDAVNTALTARQLGAVNVSQDRDKGVITLTGDLDSAELKQQAESVAKQNAPGYTISNEVGVRPPGAADQAKAVDSNLDDGIENNFKAAIKAHSNLNDQSISGDSKNGTLVIKGSVKTAAQKAQAAKLAHAIPHVKEVVNEIEVKTDKHSSMR